MNFLRKEDDDACTGACKAYAGEFFVINVSNGLAQEMGRWPYRSVMPVPACSPQQALLLCTAAAPPASAECYP